MKRAKYLKREETRAAAAGWALREMRMSITPSEVVGAVADAFATTMPELVDRTRKESLALPKHICAYLARELCGLSYTELGVALNVDRTCIIRSCQHVAHAIEVDKRVRHIVQRLKSELTQMAEAAQ